ncbi:hypothetical protein [Streptomyces sp. NPDC057740]|uniref:hypothetical protein n=1 Tax=Streptomyces sp. NPDC057740 TaxID=3346234 RepID=UPI0036B16699
MNAAPVRAREDNGTWAPIDTGLARGWPAALPSLGSTTPRPPIPESFRTSI